MKVTLKFDTSDPDQAMELKRCMKATEMAAALFEIVNNAHRHIETIDDYRKRIDDAVSDLNIDELII